MVFSYCLRVPMPLDWRIVAGGVVDNVCRKESGFFNTGPSRTQVFMRRM